MTQHHSNLSPSDAQRDEGHRNSAEETIEISFRYLEQALVQALDIVPVADPNQLLSLIADCLVPAKPLVLAELIKLDMTKAEEQGLIRYLNFYAPAWLYALNQQAMPLDLVLEEIRIRKEVADAPSLSELQQRFPHLAEMLEDYLTVSNHRTLKPMRKVPVFQVGEVIDDFQLMRLLGQGGFASVYLARQISMQRLVALKISRTQSDEPLALSRLEHPNIVSVFDQRRLQQPPVMLLYMQYVPGGTLADVVRKTSDRPLSELHGGVLLDCIDRALTTAGQQLPDRSSARDELRRLDWPRMVAQLGIQMAEGLATAHQRGIMHRDVKPANILLSAEGVPKLADFNVSAGNSLGFAGASVHFGGSLAYMSPEQLHASNPASPMAAEDLDERSDIYSLAVVLWELWHGHRPYQRTEMIESWVEAIEQQIAVRNQEFQPIRPINSAAARVLDKALRAGLSVDRQSRPRTGHAFAGQLRLAVDEKAAEYFEPAPGSWRNWILKLPVLLTTTFIAFLPNALAGALNYQYNHAWIAREHSQMLPLFVTTSIWINSIAFPVGALCLLLFSLPVQRSVRRAGQGHACSDAELDAVWTLGHRSAMVGGFMWAVAGFVFPLALKFGSAEIGFRQFAEFLLSLLICGGFAWIYPFFGISLVTTMLYYPRLVGTTMLDRGIEPRMNRLQRWATNYLGSAAAIPLFALAVLAMAVQRSSDNAGFLLVVVLLTGVALPFAFFAHQRIIDSMRILKSVLTGD